MPALATATGCRRRRNTFVNQQEQPFSRGFRALAAINGGDQHTLQVFQLRNSLPYGNKLDLRDPNRVSLLPGRQGADAKQVSDRLHFESEIPCRADEQKPMDGLVAVTSSIPPVSVALWQEISSLVVADGGNFHASGGRQFSDAQRHAVSFLSLRADDRARFL